MKIILIFLIILACFYSCDENEYFNIPQNEKPILNNNDTIYFSDTKNDIDTFIIKLSDEYEISDKRYYHEVITIKYKNVNLFGRISEFSVEHRASTNIYVDGNYCPVIYGNENTIDLEIDGETYSSVYLLNVVNRDSDSIPKSIYYSHINGIIRYDFSDSCYFEIKN